MTKRDEHAERKKELKRICLENGINNEYCLGEDLYDPRAFDYSQKKPSFGHKIKTLCFQDPETYYKYKINTRRVMD